MQLPSENTQRIVGRNQRRGSFAGFISIALLLMMLVLLLSLRM